jgi:urease gamma subunit
LLWSYNISDSTRDTIWKYLQLILFAVIGSVHNSSELGDTAKLFEAINEEELKNKLQETLENMSNLFDMKEKQGEHEGQEGENSGNGINMENMPNADDIHQHINSMMGGKLGKLAMELAEETANDLNIDMENTTDAKDVFQKLFKNPGKMMNMVKNIGNKIDEKIKSGEIKESELMSEGMDLLNKMQSMPGMGDMQKMFSQMGIPGLGKGGKLNMGAMEAMLNKNMKAAKMKERMQAKVAAKNASSTTLAKDNDNTNNVKTIISDDEIVKIFSTGEKVEKTPRGAKPPQTQKPMNSSKGKKKK